MKSNVVLSKYAFTLTLVFTIVLVVCCVLTFNEKPVFWAVLAILLLLLVCGLLYGPVAITADSEFITVNSCLSRKRISVSEIENVQLFQPTMGAYRLFASGGFFGYWGIFREGDIGKYTAYYGKASDCFILRMKNGNKYVLGCKNPNEMVAYIQNQIK